MQIVINKPKNIPALAKLNEPTMRNGKSAIKTGMALNTHAQRGKPVAPRKHRDKQSHGKRKKQKNFYNGSGHTPASDLLFDIIISLLNQKLKRLALTNLKLHIFFIVFSQKT